MPYDRLSDPILVKRAKDGDPLALEALCARHEPRVARLTLNACRDVATRRGARRHDPLDEDVRVAPGRTPDHEAELSELRADLRDGLAELPAAQARVLVLKDALGFSFEEISAASGMPVGTAKCYAHRGRAAMREWLEA